MASKLFHTIVGVGIALSAAAGCAAPGEEAVRDESALSGESTPAQTAPAATPDAGPNWDAFCDASWPTTKGGVLPLPACIDPNHECDIEEAEACAKPLGDGVCDGDLWPQPLTVCVDKQWTCKPGKVKASTCTCWTWEGGPSCATREEATARNAARQPQAQ